MLFHLSVAMYDMWEVYNGVKLNTFFLGKSYRWLPLCDGIPVSTNADSSMNVAVGMLHIDLLPQKFNFFCSVGSEWMTLCKVRLSWI
jgi:hypothetical protein